MARRNSAWAAIDFAVTPVGMLFAIPYLLGALGLEQFGILVIANSLIAFGSLFNFGFGDTALKYVSHHMGGHDVKSAAAMTRTLGMLAIASALVVALLFWLLAPLAGRLLRIDSLPYALGALHVISATMALRMTESVYVAVIRGAYRYDLAAYVTVTTKIVAIASQVALAARGYGVVDILLAVAVTVAVSNVLLFVVCWRQLGNVIPAFSSAVFAEVRGFSVWSWLQGLGGLVYANTDRLLVTALLGPAAVAVYGVCAQLAQNIHYGLSAISHSFFPTVSMLRATAMEGSAVDADRLRQLYLRVGRLLSVSAVLMGCTLAVFAREILDVWVGPEMADRGATALAVLSVSFGWFAANSIVTYYTLNGLGRAKLQAGASLISAALMLVSSVLLIPIFGLVGAAGVRFPDSVFRMGLRMHLGSSIIGSIKWWVALDFLRITIVGLACLYALRVVLYQWSPTVNVLLTPGAVAIPICMALLGAMLLRLEAWIARHASEPSRS